MENLDILWDLLRIINPVVFPVVHKFHMAFTGASLDRRGQTAQSISAAPQLGAVKHCELVFLAILSILCIYIYKYK